VFSFIAFLAFSPSAALAASTTVMVGSFMVSTDKDPFDDSGTVVAMTAEGGGVFALRCIQSTLAGATGSILQQEGRLTHLIKARSPLTG
jgi:hypothetical protein